MGGRLDPWQTAETGYPGVQTHYPEIPAESKDNTQSEPNLDHLPEEAYQRHLGLRHYHCLGLAVSCVLYLCRDGAQNAPNCTGCCYPIAF
jgi:hypothetical protein